jgi:hypothetical protein
MTDEEREKEARQKEEELLLLNWWAAFHRNRVKAQARQQPAREIRSNFRPVYVEPSPTYHSNLRNNSEARPSLYATTPAQAQLALVHTQARGPVSNSIFTFTDIDEPDDERRRRLMSREMSQHPEEARKAMAEYRRVRDLMASGQAVVIDD